ncbi:MAG: tRNA (cytidine(34)-2'-O)-methyltransferase [Nitrospirota bacterium]
MPLHIVLYQPEIPANSGNIARLSAATKTHLHLVRPLGYSLADRYLKRAGLDYWPHVKLTIHDSLQEVMDSLSGSRFFYASTKADILYTKVGYMEDDAFVFGPESRGLPEELIKNNPSTAIKIPMEGPVRSLNLSTAVGVVIYEALRQIKGY